MTALELFLRFVERYVDKSRQPRWQALGPKPLAVRKKLTQLEGQIDHRWERVDEPVTDLLAVFVTRHQPVWCWDFGTDPPDRVATAAEVSRISSRRAYLAVTEDHGKALFFNCDMTFWICGNWTP